MSFAFLTVVIIKLTIESNNSAILITGIKLPLIIFISTIASTHVNNILKPEKTIPTDAVINKGTKREINRFLLNMIVIIVKPYNKITNDVNNEYIPLLYAISL